MKLSRLSQMEGVYEDQLDHFAVMLGECCESARLAGLIVHVVLEDGREVEGVPSQPAHAAGQDELDHSGTLTRLELGGTAVVTADVRCYGVTRPR